MKAGKRRRQVPRGKLVIIGGAEDRQEENIPTTAEKEGSYTRFDALKQLVPETRKKDILVLSIGDGFPLASKKIYRKVFLRIGFKSVVFAEIKDKTDGRKKAIIEKVTKAAVVYFSGGDQFKFSTILGGTPVLEEIVNRYYDDVGFIVGGTSAGAMAMSKIMIAEGGINEGLLKSDLKLYGGFGLLEYCIVDSHFIARGRFGRLAQAVITNPGLLGVGLGEDTALIITGGRNAICAGSGTVVIIDGTKINQTNITEAEDDCPVYVENLIVHLLTKGCRFDLKERKLARPAISSKAKTH